MHRSSFKGAIVARNSSMTVGGGRMTDWSAGEVGGVFAGVLAGLAALGKGIAWLLNWQGERTEAKSKRLLVWEASLDRREAEYRESIEGELKSLREGDGVTRAELKLAREQMAAIEFSLLEVMIELRAHVPSSPALKRAATALRRVFRPEYGIPPEMAELLRAMDDPEPAASQR